jgi:hypothetical protein
MPGQSLGDSLRCILVVNASNREAVETHNGVAMADNLGLRGACALVDERKPFQETVEFGLAAVKSLRVVIEPELFNG